MEEMEEQLPKKVLEEVSEELKGKSGSGSGSGSGHKKGDKMKGKKGKKEEGGAGSLLRQLQSEMKGQGLEAIKKRVASQMHGMNSKRGDDFSGSGSGMDEEEEVFWFVVAVTLTGFSALFDPEGFCEAAFYYYNYPY